MPAVRAPIQIEAGSYEPKYWLIADPTTGIPINLTAPGYAARLVVIDRSSNELLSLGDTVFRRTADGRLYFEPSSSLTTEWASMRANYQIELSHPSGETVRISSGPFTVDRDYIKP